MAGSAFAVPGRRLNGMSYKWKYRVDISILTESIETVSTITPNKLQKRIAI
jgi:hypothetical protein